MLAFVRDFDGNSDPGSLGDVLTGELERVVGEIGVAKTVSEGEKRSRGRSDVLAEGRRKQKRRKEEERRER